VKRFRSHKIPPAYRPSRLLRLSRLSKFDYRCFDQSTIPSRGRRSRSSTYLTIFAKQNPGDQQREEPERSVGGASVGDPDGAVGGGHRRPPQAERDHRFQHLRPHLRAAAAEVLAHALVPLHLLQPRQRTEPDHRPFLPRQVTSTPMRLSSSKASFLFHCLSRFWQSQQP
jgi:hypothetical protein